MLFLQKTLFVNKIINCDINVHTILPPEGDEKNILFGERLLFYIEYIEIVEIGFVIESCIFWQTGKFWNYFCLLIFFYISPHSILQSLYFMFM